MISWSSIHFSLCLTVPRFQSYFSFGWVWAEAETVGLNGTSTADILVLSLKKK